MHISNYVLVRRDRSLNGRFGGGVCFYIRESINYSIRPDLCVDQLENLAIEIRKPRSKPFLIMTWYRPPNSTVDKFRLFETLVGRIDAEGVEYYILGDMNCNLAGSPLDHNSIQLTNIADLYGLHQFICEPTRVSDCSSSLIDLISASGRDRVVCSGVAHVGISDHSLVYVYRKLSINLVKNQHCMVSYRNFKGFDGAKFRNDISMQSWDCINTYDDPNKRWYAWKNIFSTVIDRHAPLRSKRVRSSKSPWITSHLKQRMHERDILKKKAIRSNDPNDWTIFTKYRNSVNSEIKQAKESYYVNSFRENEGNSRKTWNTINEITARKIKNSYIKEINQCGISISDPLKLSEAFNNHFSSVGPELANEIPCTANNRSHLSYLTGVKCVGKFKMKPTNSSTVLSLMRKLCKNKATGLDKISVRLIHECADLLVDSLCSIFNCSIATGIFPEDWKISKVIPLFKQGDRSDLNNYRPISIIPVIAKVFERVVYDQIFAFLNENKLLSPHQSGFRCLHSTVTALLEATDS